MQLIWGDEKEVPETKDPQNQLQIYKYILSCVYDELSRRSMDCDACNDVDTIKRLLLKLCSDQGVRIKLDKN